MAFAAASSSAAGLVAGSASAAMGRAANCGTNTSCLCHCHWHPAGTAAYAMLNSCTLLMHVVCVLHDCCSSANTAMTAHLLLELLQHCLCILCWQAQQHPDWRVPRPGCCPATRLVAPQTRMGLGWATAEAASMVNGGAWGHGDGGNCVAVSGGFGCGSCCTGCGGWGRLTLGGSLSQSQTQDGRWFGRWFGDYTVT